MMGFRSRLERLIRSKWGVLFLVVPYLLVVVVFTVGLRGLEQEGHQRCLDRQSDRQVLRQVVDISTSGAGTTLDLTQVPGFDDLDPATQTFMRNLSVGISRTPPPGRQTLHDELLAKLPPIDC